MNEMTREGFVADLRALADLYESQPNLPLPERRHWLQLDVTVKQGLGWDSPVDEEATKKAVKKAIRAMGRGRKEKEYNDYYFTCTKELPNGTITLQVKTSRAAVCRKVPTGRTIVHAAKTDTYSTPERIEEEFEWVCDDPVLAVPTKKES